MKRPQPEALARIAAARPKRHRWESHLKATFGQEQKVESRE